MKKETTNGNPRLINRAETNCRGGLKVYGSPRFVVNSIIPDAIMASSFDEKNGEYLLDDVKW